jgi:hypothetical protein
MALAVRKKQTEGSNSRILYKDSVGVDKSFEPFQVNTKNGLNFFLQDQFGDSESHAIHFENYELIPTENSPLTAIQIRNIQAQVDPTSTGFSVGDTGVAAQLYSNQVRAEGTGDVGDLAIFNNSFTVGNGTDPINLQGISYCYGFGEIRSGVTVLGSMQGYGFQYVVRSGAIVDPGAYAQAFYDNVNYEDSCSFHTSFNASITADSIQSGRSVIGFSFNPNIDVVESNAGVNGFNVAGNYNTFENQSFFQGINVNPNIGSSRYAVGLNISMNNVTPYAGVSSSVTLQDLTFTFISPSDFNNSYTMEVVSGGTAGAETVSIAGFNVQIQIESGVSTADQIKSAADASIGFSSNVITIVSGVGTNAQVAAGPVSFAGGENPGSNQAAYFGGDVQIDGSLNFSGGLSIGKLTSFGAQELIDGFGQPQSIHNLITQPYIGDNETLTTGDTIGVNTAALINIGNNSSVSTAFVGVAALGLPAVLTMGSGSTLDRCYGALFALSLDVGASGGTVDEVGLCRSVAIPNGVTTVNNLYGYLFDLPFGDPGVKTFGFYDRPGKNNYFAGQLLIGGTPFSDDIVTNSSVAFEIKSTTKAMVLPRMTTTERNALTPIAGMVIFNTTTSTMEVYDGGTWI